MSWPDQTERERVMAWLLVSFDDSRALEKLRNLVARQDADTLEAWRADADWILGYIERELSRRES